MALRFIDSFDHYATADLLDKYTNSSGSPAITTSAGRLGQSGLRTTIFRHGVTKAFTDEQATWIVGCAFRFDNYPDTYGGIIRLLDRTNTIQCDLRLLTDGRLSVTRNGTGLGTGTTVLARSAWYYLEFKCTISDAAGVAVVRINNVTDINISSVDTQNTTIASASRVQIMSDAGASGTGLQLDVDDFYICDGTGGAPNNDFLGDCRVECLLPSGNGFSSQFDGSDGNQVDNYLLVDESSPDDDTTYVESPDVGDKDTYAYGDLVTTSGTVYGVQPVPMFRKTTAGSRVARSVARLSGTETESADEMVLDSYRYSPDIRETKPGGGVWTITDVNNAEFGLKVQA